ncbi:MAG: hypothetical protein ABIT38_13075 [Gemmatimonadaceae bacterium]
MTRASIRLALWSIAALFTLTGGVFVVLPAPTGGVVEPAISDKRASYSPATLSDSSTAEEIVLANAFSTRRAPPNTRYQPVDDMADSLGMARSASGTIAMEGSGEAAAGSGPVLYGTVVGVGGAPSRALLSLDAATTGPRLYAEGEGEGGYHVVSVTPRAVVLRGASGRITLRLDPEEKRP